MNVVGIDLSFTRTGFAAIEGGKFYALDHYVSKPHPNPTLSEQAQRIDLITFALIKMAMAPPGVLDLVVIEGPSYGSKGSSLHQLGGLWWGLVCAFEASRIPVAVVVPTARAKYATGRGNAGKDEVLAAAIHRYPGVPIENNDQADAWVLACMGSRYLNEPFEDSLPQTHLSAMDKVRWPR